MYYKIVPEVYEKCRLVLKKPRRKLESNNRKTKKKKKRKQRKTKETKCKTTETSEEPDAEQ